MQNDIYQAEYITKASIVSATVTFALVVCRAFADFDQLLHMQEMI